MLMLGVSISISHSICDIYFLIHLHFLSLYGGVYETSSLLEVQQIRSGRIRSDFSAELFISNRIGLERLFHNRVGSDWMSTTKQLFL